MILKKHRGVFVHLPKCAGTSIEKTLLSADPRNTYTPEEAVLIKNKNPFKGPPSFHHLSAWQYVSGGFLSGEEWEQFFSFTVVRNPLSRIVSAYNYRGIAFRARLLGRDSWTFRDFMLKFFPTRLEENHLRGHDNWTHVQPMWRFTHDPDASKQLVKFVGRMENLKDDFQTICESLGFPPETELAHSNPSRVRDPKSGKLVDDPSIKFHWAEYFDHDTLEKARRLYEKDFELFDYSDALP